MTAAEFEAIVRKFGACEDTWWHFEVSPAPVPSRAAKQGHDEVRRQKREDRSRNPRCCASLSLGLELLRL
jgi:hypothetical protein